jgi:hypothetical protein
LCSRNDRIELLKACVQQSSIDNLYTAKESSE